MDFIMSIGLMCILILVITLHGVKNNYTDSPTILDYKKTNAPKPKPYPGDNK